MDKAIQTYFSIYNVNLLFYVNLYEKKESRF